MWSFPQNSSSPPHKGKLNQRERSVLEQDLLQLFLSSCPVYPSACLAQVDLESCPRDPRQREVNLGMSQGTHKGVSALPQSLPTTLTRLFFLPSGTSSTATPPHPSSSKFACPGEQEGQRSVPKDEMLKSSCSWDWIKGEGMEHAKGSEA